MWDRRRRKAEGETWRDRCSCSLAPHDQLTVELEPVGCPAQDLCAACKSTLVGCIVAACGN